MIVSSNMDVSVLNNDAYLFNEENRECESEFKYFVIDGMILRIEKETGFVTEFPLPPTPREFRVIGSHYVKENPYRHTHFAYYYFLWPSHNEDEKLRCDVALYRDREPNIISWVNFTELSRFTDHENFACTHVTR